MNTIAAIGVNNPLINYLDRPTVKVIIKDGTKFLILNNGLLPGGGIDDGETDLQAIERELAEELGVSVKHIKPIGCVIQYRDFIEKRYIINGYIAEISSFDKATNPQDSGEKEFTYQWLQKEDALMLIQDSIDTHKNVAVKDDSLQGKLFNLQTSLELLLLIN